jgi:site-specific recombinase XerD
LSDLTTAALQNYMIFLSIRGSKTVRPRRGEKYLSAATKQSHIAALTKFFGYLVKRGLLLTNPTHELERPRLRKTLPRAILSVEEMLKILAGIKGGGPFELRNRAALELLYSTGMRRGELEKLTLESLRLGESLVLIDGKGDRERLVPVGREAVRTLREYLEYGRPRFDSRGSDALFLSYRKGPLAAKSLLRLLKRLAKEAGISKRVDLHTVRHTCATHMLQNGADIRYIQEMLGHASLRTTQIYTRVETSDLRKMLDECHPREKF